MDGKAFGAEMVDVVKSYLERNLSPALARVDALEKQLSELRLKEGPAGKDGRDGIDGKDGLPSEKGVDGIDGAPGRDGVDGKDGLPGEKGIDGLAGIDGVHGKDGHDGKDGVPGADGRDGVPGLNGKDGVGLAGALIDRSGGLILTLTDGSTRELGPVVGKDGAIGEKGADGHDGRHGVDGVGFDDLDLIESDEGVFLRCVRGEVVKQWRLPIVIDRGVFKEGHSYRKGDGVTWGGSFWIAQGEATDKPDSGKGNWRLAVKKGRDGKDGTLKDPPKAAPVKVA